ncbi:MAG: glycosyltransferase family 39 protein, partial [Chloroflexota bacterium]|nr:glycosyltransferase family 39 protein [Chloroflexota bacterium]
MSKAVWGIVAVTVLGGLLRFYRYDALSLWLDEGYTVLFSRQPWADVLGLHGAADPSHPPGYYAAVAALRLLLPDLVAGRLLSVVAGTLTIPALYALARRLLPASAALLASLTLALSPLHYWYSQEARQYAVTSLAVALSYLALVLLGQGGGRRAVAGYIVATVAALYLDYSAAYALLPQALIFAYLLWRDRSLLRRLSAAAGGVILGYLPWLPQALTGAGLHTFYQPAFLMATPGQIGEAALAVTGVSFRSGFNPQPPPAGLWDLGSGGQLVAGLLLVGIVALGVVGLRRAGGMAALVAGCLGLGTPAVAALTSLISPGFAPRTVIYAALGWALLVGATVVALPAVGWRRWWR